MNPISNTAVSPLPSVTGHPLRLFLQLRLGWGLESGLVVVLCEDSAAQSACSLGSFPTVNRLCAKCDVTELSSKRSKYFIFCHQPNQVSSMCVDCMQDRPCLHLPWRRLPHSSELFDRGDKQVIVRLYACHRDEFINQGEDVFNQLWWD